MAAATAIAATEATTDMVIASATAATDTTFHNYVSYHIDDSDVSDHVSDSYTISEYVTTVTNLFEYTDDTVYREKTTESGHLTKFYKHISTGTIYGSKNVDIIIPGDFYKYTWYCWKAYDYLFKKINSSEEIRSQGVILNDLFLDANLEPQTDNEHCPVKYAVSIMNYILDFNIENSVVESLFDYKKTHETEIGEYYLLALNIEVQNSFERVTNLSSRISYYEEMFEHVVTSQTREFFEKLIELAREQHARCDFVRC
jgi:hypothetical protein